MIALSIIVLKAIGVAIAGLMVGDFFATFIYHVPEHVFGKLHVKIHHAKDRGFSHYAVLRPQPLLVLDGLSGFAPYLFLFPLWFSISGMGCILAYLLGQFHVIWKHTNTLGWQTPPRIVRVCEWFCIITPEQHWKHHENAHHGFGDIFTFYDRPAQQWLKFLLGLKRKLRPYYRHLAVR